MSANRPKSRRSSIILPNQIIPEPNTKNSVRRNSIYNLKEFREKELFGTFLLKLTQKYFCETSIHGLKYIMESKRLVIERMYWILATLSLWSFGIYLIYGVILKWRTSPVIVSFDSDPKPIWNIPFPAVTICNNNKVFKSKVSNTDFNHRLVNEICNKNVFEIKNTSADLDGHQIHENIRDITQSCEDLIIR